MKITVTIVSACLLAAGCATVKSERDPRDPWESYNRIVFKFNDAVDRAVLKPVAQGYTKAVPKPVRSGINNFFGNLFTIGTLVNDLLQGKLTKAHQDFGRLTMNSTFGLLGVIDVASVWGIPKNDEDFGQTLGYWGLPPGPYWVIPILGPSSIRDVGGRTVDSALNPYAYLDDDEARWGTFVLETVNTRANLLTATTVLEEAALDKYIFTRDAYFQRRLRQVYDGNPPRQKLDEEEFDDELDTKPDAPANKPANSAPAANEK